MQKLIIAIIIFMVVFFTALNTSMLADQAKAWVKDNPQDEMAPEVLYRAGRWCDLLGDNNKAMELYWDVYQQYPDDGKWVAPAMYYSAEIKVDTTSAKLQADNYLQIIMSQYKDQEDWVDKAQKLYNEVNYVR